MLRRLCATSLCLFAVTGHATDSHLEQMMTVDDAVHLSARTGIGSHAVDVAQLVNKSRKQAIDEIVTGLENRPEHAMPAWVDEAYPYMLRGSMKQNRRRAFNRNRDREFRDFKYWWLHEMLTTTSPQTERLVLFWHNHFVSAYPAIGNQSTSIARQNRLLRTHAAGNFREFLKAIIRDAAMLEYLDNRSSHKKSPNENLARELMELFTLGEGNYTESDIKNAARALTGYTVAPAHNMAFRFEHWRHDDSEKEIFGHKGNFDGDDLVELILDRPQAALFITTKFWNTFINNWQQNDKTIAEVAANFRDSDYDIAGLYRALLETEDFWSARNRLAVVKSPVDLVVGTLRTLGTPVEDLSAIAAKLDEQGQQLMAAPNVAGWKGAETWVTPNRLLARLNWLETTAGSNAVNNATLDNNSSQMNMMNEAVSSQLPDSGMQMMQDGENDVLTDSTDKSNFKRDRHKRQIVARLASDDFQGSPLVRLDLFKAGEVVWESDELELKPGRNTLSMGLSDGTQSYKWTKYRFKRNKKTATSLKEQGMPNPLLPEYDEARLHFLNDAYNADGDRNLYVDWVRVGEAKLFANNGVQSSSCIPEDPYNAGFMYCGGYLSLQPNRTQHSAQAPALDIDGLQAESVFVQWLNNPVLKSAGRRRHAEIVFNLLNVRHEDQTWDNLQFNVKYERDQSMSLSLDRYGCWPHCIAEWPDCTELSHHDPYSRYIRFRFKPDENGSLVADQHGNCQLESLKAGNRSLIEALLANLDKIHATTESGRNLERRNNLEWYNNWQPLLSMFSTEAKKHLLHKNSNSPISESAVASSADQLTTPAESAIDASGSIWRQGPFLPAGITPEVRFKAVQQIFSSEASVANKTNSVFAPADMKSLLVTEPVAESANSAKSAKSAKGGTTVQHADGQFAGFLLEPEYQLK